MHLFLVIVDVYQPLANSSDCAKKQLPVFIVHCNTNGHFDSFWVGFFKLVEQALSPNVLLAGDTTYTSEPKVFIRLSLLRIIVVRGFFCFQFGAVMKSQRLIGAISEALSSVLTKVLS